MRDRLMVFVSIFLFILVFCISPAYSFWDNLFKNDATPAPNSQGKGAGALKFKIFKYIDKEGTGIEAFRMLIPENWQFTGGLRWILNNPGMPAMVGFQVTSPDGLKQFEVFPNQPFFWTNNQMVLSMFPIGAYYFGNEVAPPVNAQQALEQIVLRRFRNDVTDLRVINRQAVPELTNLLNKQPITQPGISVSADGAKIRIEYIKNSRMIEEEIFAVVESAAFTMPGMDSLVTNINWTVDYIFSFKAEKGSLEANAKILQTIVRSFILNPQWFSKYNQVVEFLVQNQIKQINNTAQLSKIISQTQNEISDMIMDTYNYRQQVNDKISDDFSQAIRGVEDYYDPGVGHNVELPNGYQDAWTNKQGEYIVSDDPNFNPNIGATMTWEKMEKAQ